MNQSQILIYKINHSTKNMKSLVKPNYLTITAVLMHKNKKWIKFNNMKFEIQRTSDIKTITLLKNYKKKVIYFKALRNQLHFKIIKVIIINITI
jgi:hypothetical protein